MCIFLLGALAFLALTVGARKLKDDGENLALLLKSLDEKIQKLKFRGGGERGA